MSDALMAKDNDAEIRRRFDQAVFLIGVGLREKDAAYEADPHRYPYSSNFRHGLNIFAALCAECADAGAIDILDGLSESSFISNYCTRGVAEWTARWSKESREAVLKGETADIGPLASVDAGMFVLTDECHDLILYAENDTLGAYQERKVYEFLRAGTQEQYVFGRRFLIRNPLLSWDAYTAVKTGRCSFEDDALDQGEGSNIEQEWLTELLDMAYEETPDGTKVCPRCGWTMAKRGRQPYCSSPTCCDSLPLDYGGLEDVPHGTLRLTRGVMHYISAPGGLELEIAKRAQSLGLSFELWPQKDVCDVLVTLPDGVRLALDAKTYGSAAKLAKEIKRDNAIAGVGADEVIYVVPDDAEARHPGYCVVCSQALASKEGYSCCTLNSLFKRLRDASGEAR